MRWRRAATAVASALLCALALASAAGAGSRQPPALPPLSYGVADNASLFADDGGAWFDTELQGAHLTENRWELQWDPTRPTAIAQLAFLERAAPVAQANGVRVVLALDSANAAAHAPGPFCAWAAHVAATAAQWGIHDYVVWNEPNTALYWKPQNAKTPAAYERLLATCYDAIHAADPQARVIGFGLSPRSDGPSQTAPIPFIQAVGAAYRASGRTLPIMDQMSIHPYPNPNRAATSPGFSYGARNAGSAYLGDYGLADLARVKQALYDAFHGTAQPTTLDGLTLRIDEFGWQTDTSQDPQYFNAENAQVVSQQEQAAFVASAVRRYIACDPSVTDVDWFLLVDEASRNGRSPDGKTVFGGGWQSGLLTAGGPGVSQPKPAYTEDAPLFAAGRAACTAGLVAWRPQAAPQAAPLLANPYAKARGYDLSYPNCARRLPPPQRFAIVGVNGGRPFTFNPCLGREYGRYAKAGPAAVYLNTGYETRFARHVTPACASAARQRPRPTRRAYAIGCSEAASSLAHLSRLRLRAPQLWWLDVETSNVWSGNRVLNTAVLRGMTDYLARAAPASRVGIYSQRSWWREITRGWRPAVPEWVPGGGGACPAPFARGPVWLAQGGGARIDVDAGCLAG